ncbi:MAG: guanylate kinase [Patescibacteria group bacterium]|nr:guanylate kinase [Patescibacteria group bacterium]
MKIEQLATNYKINQSGIDVVRKAKTVFIVGITSAGKDTIVRRLLNSSDYRLIISHTTRQPRANNGVMEKDGQDYHFVSVDQMADLLANHKMIEVNCYGGNYYGVSVGELADASRDNKISISDIEVNGISSFYNIAPGSVTAIFIVPPDYETWQKRIRNRYESVELFNKDWNDRREIAINELEHVLSVPHYHFVINDDIDRAVKVADKIAHHENNIFGRGDDEARLRARDLLDAIKRDI